MRKEGWRRVGTVIMAAPMMSATAFLQALTHRAPSVCFPSEAFAQERRTAKVAKAEVRHCGIVGGSVLTPLFTGQQGGRRRL